MSGSFGIDHPLLATHDIAGLRDRLISLGFNMTEIGQHPWGTSTSLAMFNGCLLEIMGVYDASLINEIPAGDFRFGRHVYDHLQHREGVALSALHSTDSVADALAAMAAGYDVAGHLEFGRDVTLPDGRADRTKTTLALLPDPDFPRLSFFLCQQHRPDLIYVPEWLEHPNSAYGIAGVTILADQAAQNAILPKLSALYGTAEPTPFGFDVQTANGSIHVQNAAGIEAEFGDLTGPIMSLDTPSIVAMDIIYASDQNLKHWVENTLLHIGTTASGHFATNPNETANTILRFVIG